MNCNEHDIIWNVIIQDEREILERMIINNIENIESGICFSIRID